MHVKLSLRPRFPSMSSSVKHLLEPSSSMSSNFQQAPYEQAVSRKALLGTVAAACLVVGLGVLALVIINALKANKGIAGVYPISFPILK